MVMIDHQRCHNSLEALRARIRNAAAVTPAFMSGVVASACACLVEPDNGQMPERIRLYVRSEAWVDAVLALGALSLPHWRICGITNDDGAWRCEVAKKWPAPVWLDCTVAATHEVLPLAVLLAFMAASQNDRSGILAPVNPVPFGPPGEPSIDDPGLLRQLRVNRQGALEPDERRAHGARASWGDGSSDCAVGVSNKQRYDRW